MSDARTANLLGAAALTIVDELAAALPPERDAAALVLVGQYPDEGVDALARRLELTHSGAVRLVDRLAAAGLLTRAAARDRRRVTLRLTRRGETRAREILHARSGVLEQLVGGLAAGERAALERVLERWLTTLTADATHAERICRLCDLEACPLQSCPVEQAA